MPRALRGAYVAMATLCLALPAVIGAQSDAPRESPGVTRPAVAESSALRAGTVVRRRARRHVRRARAEAPLRYRRPMGAEALADDLGAMLRARVRSGAWGALVVSLSRGDTIFAYDPDAELRPASNMKLFTTAIALQEFGPGHEFNTDVFRTGPIDPDGTLHGDLVVRGDGDPSISRRFYDGGAAAAMAQLAGSIAAAGVKRVTGALIADASAFDPQRIPEGWKTRYLQAGYAARVSALSLNENLATVVIQPGRSGGPASVSLDPPTDMPLRASVRTVAGRGARIMAHSTDGGAIEVRGWIGSRAGIRGYQVVVEDPTAFAAGALRRAIEARGITFGAPTRYAATPAGAIPVASLPSPPLAQLIAVMNRESINHYAELLFRDAGRKAAPGAVGSVESGDSLLQRFLTHDVGASPGSVVATDGSGLSVLDRVTPRALVQLLAYANRAPWGDAFHASLPVAGESELLKHRMRYTPAQGNLHAKTGTTNDVISLGGYVTARDGELLAFAFIYNGRDRWNAKTTIDAMGATLASFVR